MVSYAISVYRYTLRAVRATAGMNDSLLPACWCVSSLSDEGGIVGVCVCSPNARFWPTRKLQRSLVVFQQPSHPPTFRRYGNEADTTCIQRSCTKGLGEIINSTLQAVDAHPPPHLHSSSERALRQAYKDGPASTAAQDFGPKTFQSCEVPENGYRPPARLTAQQGDLRISPSTSLSNSSDVCDVV